MTQYSYSQSFGQLAVSGSTPYGTYDNDQSFLTECNKTSLWIVRKLGHPVLNVELNDIHLYGSYEEATLKYNSIITSHQATNWFLDYIGSKVSSSADNFTNQLPRSDLSFLKRLIEPYGIEANVNTNVTLYSGSFVLAQDQQTIDLNEWQSINEPSYSIDIQNVYHQPTPSMLKSAYFGAGITDFQLDWYSADYGGLAVGAGMYARRIHPVFSNVLREQQTEMYHTVRRGNYSYILHNNFLRLTPTPNSSLTVWFTYYKQDPNKEYNVLQADATVTGGDTHHLVTSIADIPFQEIVYSTLNPMAKDWIRRYTMAISKEILGHIRGKFSSIPIPNSEVTLNADNLLSDAKEEKTTLIEELNASLESLSIEVLMEKKAAIAESIGRTLTRIPFKNPIMIM